MPQVLLLLPVLLLPAPLLAPGCESTEPAEATVAYRLELLDSVPAARRQPASIAKLRRGAVLGSPICHIRQRRKRLLAAAGQA